MTATVFGLTPSLVLIDAICGDSDCDWDTNAYISYEQVAKLAKSRALSCNREYLGGMVDVLGAVYDKEFVSLVNDLLVVDA